MQLATTRFGMVEVNEQEVITFTQPIIGFQQYRRFILIPGPEGSPVTWLQSTESGGLAFLLMEPRAVISDYAVRLSEWELRELAAEKLEDIEIYTLLVVPEDRSKMRTNLKAPIVINRQARLGKQTVLESSDYPIQFFLMQGQQEAAAHREVGNARSDS